MKRWQHVWRLLPLMVMMLALTGCGEPFLSALDPKGPVAEEQLSLIMLSLYIMMAVFAVVAVIFIYVLIRFRKRPGQDEIPKQVEGSHTLEIIWTVIPIVLLVILAVPTVTLTFDLAEKQPADSIQVHVTAHQFWWEFEYPDLGITTAQELYIPVGKKIQFHLTADDVKHSFWVPALGGKIDTNPGSTNAKWLQADEVGTYEGLCAELCGASHALMYFKVEAVSQEDFDTWVANLQGYTATPATDSELQGQAIFQQQCISCHAVGKEGGVVGPNLAGFADRNILAGIMDNNEENLAGWIKDPQSYKPGNAMPGFATLKDEELSALVDYLKSLKLNQQ
jgi:cytochrome c oxidase subunit 2